MKIPLSTRLQACCGFIKPGDRVADIGCDHGYLSIYLLKNGIASAAYACDVAEGPLQSARRNAVKFGVSEKISFHLSDGVRNVPRDFDTMVCAGMGGDTMVSILTAAPWLKDGRYRLVLQCQSKRELLRQYLSDNGWHIAEESVLRDGRFLYTVMDVGYDPSAPRLTLGQTYFPPAMLVNPSPETKEYYDRVIFSLTRAVTNGGDQTDPAIPQALEELRGVSW
jgi:tRNA (adenine22-N1)-methyltransferase